MYIKKAITLCSVSILSACALTNTMTGKYTDIKPLADNLAENYRINEALLRRAFLLSAEKCTGGSKIIKNTNRLVTKSKKEISNTNEVFTPSDTRLKCDEAAVISYKNSTVRPLNNEERNILQDSLIAKSNYLCELYKHRLRLGRAHINFGLGALAAGAAGASAIVSGPLASDILGASAAFLIGTRAEYNEAYFEQASIQIVTKGIDSRRTAIIEHINSIRINPVKSSIVNYTPARAVSDAMQYHMSCSIGAALEEAADKIDESNNPTIENAEKHLKALKKLFGKSDKDGADGT